jgi:hypothetical protein
MGYGRGAYDARMPVLAAGLACVVIGIADGDTLTARCELADGKENITVRVADPRSVERSARAAASIGLRSASSAKPS